MARADVEAMDLTIITPCIRAANLPRLRESIVKSCSAIPKFQVRWLIVFDDREPLALALGDPATNLSIWMLAVPSEGKSINGNIQRNLALDHTTYGRVYFLDDDTTLCASLVPRLAELVRESPHANFVFNQSLPDGTLRCSAAAENMVMGKVDSGQAILMRETIGNRRWQEMIYEADGILFQDIHERFPESFRFINETLSVYNALR